VRDWCDAGGSDSTEASSNEDVATEKANAAVDRLVRIGREAALWHDPIGVGYATIGRVTYPIKSNRFRQHLIARFMDGHGDRVPNSDAVTNAITALQALAVTRGDEHPMYVRAGVIQGKSISIRAMLITR
jgi:hypothetical protein